MHKILQLYVCTMYIYCIYMRVFFIIVAMSPTRSSMSPTPSTMLPTPSTTSPMLSSSPSLMITHSSSLSSLPPPLNPGNKISLSIGKLLMTPITFSFVSLSHLVHVWFHCRDESCDLYNYIFGSGNARRLNLLYNMDT